MPTPRDPNGYLEWGGLLGALSAPDHWHDYGGNDLYGAAADQKFLQYTDGSGGTELKHVGREDTARGHWRDDDDE